MSNSHTRKRELGASKKDAKDTPVKRAAHWDRLDEILKPEWEPLDPKISLTPAKNNKVWMGMAYIRWKFDRPEQYGLLEGSLMLASLVKNDDGWFLLVKSSAIERYGIEAVEIMARLRPEKAKAWRTFNSRQGCLKKLRVQK